jgi:hypothetical protein
MVVGGGGGGDDDGGGGGTGSSLLTTSNSSLIREIAWDNPDVRERAASKHHNVITREDLMGVSSSLIR